MKMKYFTKHVQVRNITHAKETICALLNTQEELLEALKEIAELNTMYPPNYNTMTEAQKCEWTHYGKFAVIARAAIAKATGE